MAVRSSVLEHNRATLFASWQQTFASGQIGRFIIYDLWSDGIGDVFCALPHLAAEFRHLTPSQRSNVIVNTSRPDLMRLLDIPDLRVTHHDDLGTLERSLTEERIATIHSIRGVNYSLPFDIHTLICGSLGLRAAEGKDLAIFRKRLLSHRPTDRIQAEVQDPYCVVHLEFARDGHHGRALSASRAQELLALCTEYFGQVVLVGRERRFTCPEKEARDRVLDLQGRLSLDSLLAVVANAAAFVGIDSLPSHIAQAAGVPAAVFFGSVHPLTRVWDAQRVWPLVADLRCIGCYHMQIEPSVPFCMRYDVACTDEVEPAHMRRVLEQMRSQTPFDWVTLTERLRSLQSRLVSFLRYHPAPPNRMFREHPATNEQISNMIYQIIDKMGKALRGQYHTAIVQMLSGRVAELEAEAFTQSVALDEARRELRARQSIDMPPSPRTERTATQILQLRDIAFTPVRCRTEVRDQWLNVVSESDDPQLWFPMLRGCGGRVRLRLAFVAEHVDLVQVFWASSADLFSVDHMQEMTVSDDIATLDRVFDLATGESLCLRIDPLAGAGCMRMRGSLAGIFRIEPDEKAADEASRMTQFTASKDLASVTLLKAGASHADARN